MLAARNRGPAEALAVLNCHRLPARLNSTETCVLLGFQEHDVPVLIAAKLLSPLGKSATGTRHWCSTLPPRLQPHFARITSLPYQLAWACVATLCPGENDRWVAPFVRATVRHVLNKQKEFLEQQMLAAEVAREQRARQIMLEKLASSGPCLLRELLRRYSIQRRDVHQPVLDALLNEGLVRHRDDGRLELTGASTIKA